MQSTNIPRGGCDSPHRCRDRPHRACAARPEPATDDTGDVTVNIEATITLIEVATAHAKDAIDHTKVVTVYMEDVKAHIVTVRPTLLPQKTTQRLQHLA